MNRHEIRPFIAPEHRWLVIGVIVAAGHAYLVHLTAFMPILSAILAVLLWPLVLLGVNLHIR